MTTISELRTQIYKLHKANDCSENVLKTLYDGTNFIEQEDYLWDYKVGLDLSGKKLGSKPYQAKICEIAKDIAAFHNTLGGYIIFGVEDKTGKIVGCDEVFPADDLLTRLKSDLKKNRRHHCPARCLQQQNGIASARSTEARNRAVKSFCTTSESRRERQASLQNR